MIITIAHVRHYLCTNCGKEWCITHVVSLDDVPFKCGVCGQSMGYVYGLATNISGERSWVMASGLRTTVGG